MIKHTAVKKRELIEEIEELLDEWIDEKKTLIFNLNLNEDVKSRIISQSKSEVACTSMPQAYAFYEKLIKDELGFYVMHKVVKARLDELIAYDTAYLAGASIEENI